MLVDISKSIISVGEGRGVYLLTRNRPTVFKMGQRLHNLGGTALMRRVHERVHRKLENDELRSGDAAELQYAWAGIGDWIP